MGRAPYYHKGKEPVRFWPHPQFSPQKGHFQMQNPFTQRAVSLSGPATDIQPVTPNDTAILPHFALALYVETGGIVVFDTITGATRSVEVADFSILPVGAQRVRAQGTTASGIHALVLA
jgi:hypothetical protein